MSNKAIAVWLIVVSCASIGMLFLTKGYNESKARVKEDVSVVEETTVTTTIGTTGTTATEQTKTVKQALGITYKTENNTGFDLIQIKELGIDAKIKLGTDVETLNYYVGQYEDCGEIGKGNICLAAHSGDGDYIFNALHEAKKGMLVNLITKEGIGYNYYITESFVIEPDEMWVTEDFHDERVTMVTCENDGEQRLVVIAKLMSESQYEMYKKENKL